MERSAIVIARAQYESEREEDAESFARFLLEQWPCAEPTVMGAPESTSIDLTGAMIEIRPEWLRLFQNSQLSEHVDKVQRVLDRHHKDASAESQVIVCPGKDFLPERRRGRELPTLPHDLLSKGGRGLESASILAPSRADDHELDITTLDRLPSNEAPRFGREEFQTPLLRKCRNLKASSRKLCNHHRSCANSTVKI